MLHGHYELTEKEASQLLEGRTYAFGDETLLHDTFFVARHAEAQVRQKGEQPWLRRRYNLTSGKREADWTLLTARPCESSSWAAAVEEVGVEAEEDLTRFEELAAFRFFRRVAPLDGGGRLVLDEYMYGFCLGVRSLERTETAAEWSLPYTRSESKVGQVLERDKDPRRIGVVSSHLYGDRESELLEDEAFPVHLDDENSEDWLKEYTTEGPMPPASTAPLTPWAQEWHDECMGK